MRRSRSASLLRREKRASQKICKKFTMKINATPHRKQLSTFGRAGNCSISEFSLRPLERPADDCVIFHRALVPGRRSRKTRRAARGYGSQEGRKRAQQERGWAAMMERRIRRRRPCTFQIEKIYLKKREAVENLVRCCSLKNKTRPDIQTADITRSL